MHYTLSPIYSPKNRGPESRPGKSRRKLLQVFNGGGKDEKMKRRGGTNGQPKSCNPQRGTLTASPPTGQHSMGGPAGGRTRLWEEQLCKHLPNFLDRFQSHLGRLLGGVVKTMNPGALLPGLDLGSTAYWLGALEKAPELSLPQLPIQPISPSIDHGAAGKMQ